MHKARPGIIPALMILSIMAISGCTTTWLDMKSWHGRTLDDLYFEWGKPDEIEGSGYTWISTWTDNGEEKTCRKTFYTRYDGHAEVIVKTSYSDCHFLTTK